MLITAERIEGHGIRGRLPPGWSGRLFRPPAVAPDISSPILHSGNFAISIDDTGFGSDLTEHLAPGRVAVVFVEYTADDILRPGEGLYAEYGFPSNLTISDFTSTTLQVFRPEHVGMQSFLTIGPTRLGVLYVVLGSQREAEAALVGANEFLGSLEFASSPTGVDYRPAVRCSSFPRIGDGATRWEAPNAYGSVVVRAS